MCGIAGRLHLDGAPVDRGALERMCDLLHHRGPDGRGTHADGPVGLAHTRLAILDLSTAGEQPMSDPRGRHWIVYNGEVYNFLELRKELEHKGHRFRSRTDTEVLLHLYQEYGESCVTRLRGMFAFAIWNAEAGELFLARDRVGKKPLYYHHGATVFAFASELKAILADPGIARRIRPDALCDFMTYGFVPDPKTIFEGIHKLLPGHTLTIGRDGVRLAEYWDLRFAGPLDAADPSLAEGVVTRLRDAVQCRLISDVPLGAFLSGGIDSSAVVAMMSELGRGEVITSSIGFAEEAFDELDYARIVARRFGTTHHEDVVRYETFHEIVNTLLGHLEEPFCDESAIATYYLCKLTRRHVTVALSGDGGDEGFAGYRKYGRMMAEERWRGLLGGRWAGPLAALLRRAVPAGVGRNLARVANFLESVAASRPEATHLANAHLRGHERRALFAPRFGALLDGYGPQAQVERYYRRAGTDDFLSAVLYVDTKFLLPGDFLVKVDRMSMANSLEVRCPFLDHHLLEYAASIPSRLKLEDGETKRLLKTSLRGHLPDEILYRPKRGFDVPIGLWFENELRADVERELVGDPGALAEFFNGDYVRRVWSEFLHGRRGHKSILWNLLMFKLWHRRWA